MPVAAAALLIGLGPGAVPASVCAGWTVQTTPDPGSTDNSLNGVAAISATNVWAVGSYSDSPNVRTARTLVVHWDGRAWKQQSSPSPGSGVNVLSGVAGTSATNVWAVGYYRNFANTSTQTLIVHWNGTAWKRVPSPSPGGSGAGHNSALSGVVAVSATDAWAVGSYSNSTGQALIVHWNGRAWKQVPSPGVSGASNQLSGVAATAASNVSAVGFSASGSPLVHQTLIVHWNGTAWKRVSSPNPHSCADSNSLFGVAATSATNAWAVGTDLMCPGSGSENLVSLIVHWNGAAWKQQASPNPFDPTFYGLAATSATNAWAVGMTNGATLIVHWNGAAWKQQPSPNPAPYPGSDDLLGVVATSATNAWAVGTYNNPDSDIGRTLAVHGC